MLLNDALPASRLSLYVTGVEIFKISMIFNISSERAMNFKIRIKFFQITEYITAICTNTRFSCVFGIQWAWFVWNRHNKLMAHRDSTEFIYVFRKCIDQINTHGIITFSSMLCGIISVNLGWVIKPSFGWSRKLDVIFNKMLAIYFHCNSAH